MAGRMHDDEVAVDVDQVRALVDRQFPRWARLPLRAVEPWGTDHAIWRLGDELTVRLPRIDWATEQVELEATWLPVLAPHLPVAVPEPVAIGEPDLGYPHRWAVHTWLPGRMAGPETIDADSFAADLAATVLALRSAPTAGAPAARHRARPLASYDDDARRAIAAASHLVDAAAATAVWEAALDAPPHTGPPVWVHGDLDGNCLVADGRLCGLLDWGSMCVGDPAADLKVVWSPLFTAETRAVTVAALGGDDARLARGRGMVVQQACAALPYYLDSYPLIVERARHQLSAIGVGSLR